MKTVTPLRDSNARLLELDAEIIKVRNALINHPSNNANLSSNATYFPYLSLVDKYTGFANEYNNELLIFKELLQKTVNNQKNNSNSSATSVSNNEITSNYLPTNILSCPVLNDNVENIDVPYTNDDSNASSTSSRQIATPNTNDNEEEEEPVSDEKELVLPKIAPLSAVQDIENESVHSRSIGTNSYNKKLVKAKVFNRMSYKYEGRGFDIWKKNGRRAIYNETELYCSRTFGEDAAGIAKLKRFLIKRGGFKANCIEDVKILKASRDDNKFGLIKVRTSQENIENGMEKINNGKEEEEISIYRRRNSRYWTAQNKKLYVKNFDIMSAMDHRKMTNMFLRFGDLETDIFMNRDRNGNPYCFVQFRNIEDAISCEKNQNLYSRNRKLWFNGKELFIEYVDNTKNNNGNKKNKKGRSRKYNNY